MSHTLTLADLDAILTAIEHETIDQPLAQLKQQGEFAANPVLTAARELYGKVKEAAHQVAIEGQEALQTAINSVVQTWEDLKEKLGDTAEELLEIFHHQMSLLMGETVRKIMDALPKSLEGGWENELASVSAQLSLTISPSVEISVERWLKLACVGGLQVTATYAPRPS